MKIAWAFWSVSASRRVGPVSRMCAPWVLLPSSSVTRIVTSLGADRSGSLSCARTGVETTSADGKDWFRHYRFVAAHSAPRTFRRRYSAMRLIDPSWTPCARNLRYSSG